MESAWILRLLLLFCMALLPTVADDVIGCFPHNGILTTDSSTHAGGGKDPPELEYCGDINDGPTTCCLKGQECLSNNLCYNKTTDTVSREYCSDIDWPEDRCSLLCPEWKGGGVELFSCDKNKGKKSSRFCCAADHECCQRNNYTQIDEKGKILGTGYAISSATSTPSSSSASDASSSNFSSNGGSGGMSEKAKLGVGLGIGLGVPLVSAIAAALYLWHRNLLARARADANGGNGPFSPDQMAKVASPGSGSGAATGSTPGREVEPGYTPAVYQLEADENVRNELGDNHQAHELY